MPVSAATLKLLIDAGVTGDALVAIVASIDEDAAPREQGRSAGAIRQERYRKRHAVTGESVTCDVTRDVTDVTQCDAPPPPKERSPTPPKEITPTLVAPSESARPSKAAIARQAAAQRREDEVTWTAEFDVWFPGYPRTEGRIPARKNYLKVRASGVSAEELDAARDRYVAHCRRTGDLFCHAATWLAQERWRDAYPAEAPQQQRRAGTGPPPGPSKGGNGAMLNALARRMGADDNHEGPTIDGERTYPPGYGDRRQG